MPALPWLQNKFEKNFLITTVDYVFNWARKSAVWPMTFGLACCAIEMIASSTARFDIARFVTGVRANWRDCAPDPRPRVYFANHNSHGDFVLIWTVLPPSLRRLTRPVAGADYWTVSAPRRFFVVSWDAACA